MDNQSLLRRENLTLLFQASVIVVIIIAFLYLTQSILKPIVFAFLFAIALLPLCRFFETGLSRFWSTALSMVVAVTVLALSISFLYAQMISAFSDSSELGKNLGKLLNSVDALLFPYINVHLSDLTNEDLLSQIKPSSILELLQGLLNYTSIILSATLATIYTFFILLYRSAFYNLFVDQYQGERLTFAKEKVESIKNVSAHYFKGLALTMLILCVLNALGLSIIGLKHPVFWAIFASILAFIPYIGTAAGMGIATLYALASTGDQWFALMVLAWFFVVQQIEGNFITPKVVGGQVEVNPLFALISISFGYILWGMAGVILAIPGAAILRIILGSFDITKAYSEMMSSAILKKGPK